MAERKGSPTRERISGDTGQGAARLAAIGGALGAAFALLGPPGSRGFALAGAGLMASRGHLRGSSGIAGLTTLALSVVLSWAAPPDIAPSFFELALLGMSGAGLLALALAPRLGGHGPWLVSLAGGSIAGLGVVALLSSEARGLAPGASGSAPVGLAPAAIGLGLFARAQTLPVPGPFAPTAWMPFAAGGLLLLAGRAPGLLPPDLARSTDVLVDVAASALMALAVHGALRARSDAVRIEAARADQALEHEREHAAEQERLHRNALLELALGASSMGVGWWDGQLDRIELDERAMAILDGPEGPPLDRRTYYALVHPDDREQVRAAAIASRVGSDNYELQHRVLRRDGSLRYVHIRAVRLRDAEGGTSGVAALIADITEQRYQEEALRESEDRLRLALEEAPFPIMLHADDGAVLLVNRIWTERTGYEEAELSTVRDWARLAYREASDDVLEQIASLYQIRERVDEGVFTVTTRSGEQRLWEFRSVPLGALPDGRRLVMSCASDVTDRDLARELARSNAELETFAYVASHDLQQPLRMVASFVQLLSRRYRDRLDEEADRYIGFAVEGAGRMQRLLADLLSYSRAGRGGIPATPVPGQEVAREAIDNLLSDVEEAGARIAVGPLPSMRGNRSQLVAVFQNLIANAIKYGGRQIDIGGEEREFDAVVYVRDDGIGFPQEHAERIFRPFQRLHEPSRYPGSGIGLAIVHRIVTRYGGRAWAESRPGQGSTFWFAIPHAGMPAADPPRQAVPA